MNQTGQNSNSLEFEAFRFSQCTFSADPFERQNLKKPSLSYENTVLISQKRKGNQVSSSPYVSNPTNAWIVNFNNGNANSNTMTNTNQVRCVAGGS